MFGLTAAEVAATRHRNDRIAGPTMATMIVSATQTATPLDWSQSGGGTKSLGFHSNEEKGINKKYKPVHKDDK